MHGVIKNAAHLRECDRSMICPSLKIEMSVKGIVPIQEKPLESNPVIPAYQEGIVRPKSAKEM